MEGREDKRSMNQIWTKSVREEIIGVLWLILTVLLLIAHAPWTIFIIPFLHGITTEIAAIYFAWRESKEEKTKAQS